MNNNVKLYNSNIFFYVLRIILHIVIIYLIFFDIIYFYVLTYIIYLNFLSSKICSNIFLYIGTIYILIFIYF